MTQRTNPPPSEQNGNLARLLIVDDEPPVRELLARWLSAEGYACETTEDVEHAEELLERDAVSLVIADIRLPGKSGMDLLRLVGERFPDVAVVMATAVDDREAAIRALETGAYGYVVKPFKRNEVVINVVNALERRKMLLEKQDYERGLEETIREQTEDIRLSRREIALRLIAAQEYRHDESGSHIRRIGRYAGALGRRLGYSEEQAEFLSLAAAVHDVGKIGVPDSVLLKPGKLTPEERKAMEKHTTIGGRILEGTHIPLLNLARDVALCHHEKWDGSGYPFGLSGDDIPEAARIVGVLDVYDALVHKRVYRPAMREEEALQVMKEQCESHFDSNVFDVFLAEVPALRRIQQGVREPRVLPLRAPSDFPGPGQEGGGQAGTQVNGATIGAAKGAPK